MRSDCLIVAPRQLLECGVWGRSGRNLRGVALGQMVLAVLGAHAGRFSTASCQTKSFGPSSNLLQVLLPRLSMSLCQARTWEEVVSRTYSFESVSRWPDLCEDFEGMMRKAELGVHGQRTNRKEYLLRLIALAFCGY
jgi:hypothetical protein